MIEIYVNKAQFEYDIHSLTKAFFPSEELIVNVEEGLFISSQNLETGLISMVENASQRNSQNVFLLVFFEDEKITVNILENEKILAKTKEIEASLEKAILRNQLKQLLYDLLTEFSGTILPWGTLTGIRPTKIPMSLLEQGMDEAEILNYMKDTYLLHDKKAELSLDIAKREKKILSQVHYEEGYSLYIGIPFCPTTCLYCSFTSYPISSWKKRMVEYLEALSKEMEYVSKACSHKILDSVYIGGGTPTTLEAEELEQLLFNLRKYFPFEHVKEFTVEAGRADSITYEKLQVLKKYNVTRISVNPQTMKESTLKIIGRQHTVEQVIEAFGLARKAGFTNINMDLILGLPGETKEDVMMTFEEIKKLAPDSITVHSLAIKRASKLSKWIVENGMESMNNTEETMKIAADCAMEMGMKPYYLYRQKNMSGNFENVGYATDGNYGLYNILIMEEKQ
ncbi:MAG: coproporphyrinogen dehydrogenase HemZ, partial [Clostridiales bacterium]|nr:coproporphyrinogen dehydrogenase HemZ [Clostridiales bacterium]